MRGEERPAGGTANGTPGDQIPIRKMDDGGGEEEDEEDSTVGANQSVCNPISLFFRFITSVESGKNEKKVSWDSKVEGKGGGEGGGVGVGNPDE